MSYLSQLDFAQVIENTPLISIDLIVSNSGGEILLGKRQNKPAKGYWFVPGGRVRKNETIVQSFKRLLREELDLEYTEVRLSPLGLYEHFYQDCVFSDKISTHYIVNAYQVTLHQDRLPPLNNQHSVYSWMKIQELLDCPYVHDNTKAYFQNDMQADSKLVAK